MDGPAQYGSEYTEYQSNRSRIRKLARTPWLRAAEAYVEGPAVDLGCGVGELLARLPAGSMGLEINRSTIERISDSAVTSPYGTVIAGLC